MQLSFANAQEFIEEGMRRKGGVIVDSSIFGMGRGAGNLTTELITQYINKTYGFKYDIVPLLKVADRYLNEIYMKTPWGYATPYFLSAINNCHPNYANFLMTKKTLSMDSIAKILNLIPQGSRELYDKKLITRMYLDFQSSEADDSRVLPELKKLFVDRLITVVASGRSVKNYADEIKARIFAGNSLVVHINSLKDGIPADFIFISNSRRAESMKIRDNKPVIIATSNIKETLKADYTVNYSSLLGNNSELDNAGLMFLNLLMNLGIKKVQLAGFDGFTYDPEDYLEFVTESYMRRDLEHRNQEIKDEMIRISQKMEISFITPSLYEFRGKK